MFGQTRNWVSLAAGIAAAFGCAGGASAADFGDGGPALEEDYEYGKRPYLSGGDHRYSERYDYRGRHDRDDDDDDLRDPPEHDGRYSDDDPDDDDIVIRRNRDHVTRRGPEKTACVDGGRVRQRLMSDGWTRFKLAKYGEGVAVIRAERRHSGRPFLLKIDGCSGRLISARPIYGRHWSGYNSAPHPRYSFKD